MQEALEIVDADKTAVEQGIHDWKKKRTGLQIATQDLQPWVDLKHRRVFYARHLESGKVSSYISFNHKSLTKFIDLGIHCYCENFTKLPTN